jgi:hypothetical protein
MSRRKNRWRRVIAQAIRAGHSDPARIIPRKAGERVARLVADLWKQMRGTL